MVIKIHTLLMATVLATAVALAILVRGYWTTQYNKVITKEDIFYLPPPIWMKVFAVGFNEATADIIWGKTIVYFAGAPKKRPKKNEYITEQNAAQFEKLEHQNFTMNYVGTVTALDPHFKAAYLHGATLTMYHQGVITRQTIQMAIDLLEQGIAIFPDNGEMLFNLGFLYYYEMKPFLKGSKREAAQQKGIKLFQAASLADDAPRYAKRLTESLAEQHGLTDLVIHHLETQLANETDPHIREYLANELQKELHNRTQQDLTALNMLYKQWRNDAAFIPFSLYTILVEPPHPEQWPFVDLMDEVQEKSR